MKVINSNVEIYYQQPGIEGMLTQIEKVGRMCYKSEDKITEDSNVKFVSRIIESGHWSVLEFGTVYLKITADLTKSALSLKNGGHFSDDENMLRIFIEAAKTNSKAARINVFGDTNYITTNLRFILQLKYKYPEFDWKNWVTKFWCDPEIESKHELRICTHWTTSRFVSAQALRHRVFSMMQESQRYCNYSNINKFSEGVQFIIPYWAKKLANVYGINEDSNTLWDDLIKLNDKEVISRMNYWKTCEDEYIKEIKMGLLPEEARGCLCNDAKTEFCLCGFESDWMYKPIESSPEKTGFFFLRTANSAQGDIRILAKKLEIDISSLIKIYHVPDKITTNEIDNDSK